MITEVNYREYSFREIYLLTSSNSRDKIINLYKRDINTLLEVYPSYENIILSQNSLDSIIFALENALGESKSTYINPGETINYYPILTEHRAKAPKTCMISASIINAGSYYYSFKAFLYNPSNKQCYVTSPIIFEIGSDFKVPMTLSEFEQLCYKIQNSYSLELEEEYNIETFNFKINKLSPKKYKKSKKS